MLNTVLQPVLLGALALLMACIPALAQPMADSPRQAVLTLIGRYAENQELDAGMAEIVAWHQASHSILVINAKDASVDVLDASMLASAALDSPLSASSLSRRGRIQVGRDVSIAAGSVNSVAVRGSLMAVAVEHDDKQADGVIAFYTLDGGGKAAFQKQVAAGPLPDSVAFTPDGATLLVANEGEPSDDYTRDPEGSVTLIAVRDGVAADTGTRVGFADFNAGGGRADELGDGVRISHPKASVAQDLEPEFVAASTDNTTAYVSLQENNALAVIDIAGRQVRRLIGLGAKDHGAAGNGLDASNKDGAINIRTVDGLTGLYMPDTIAAFVHDGTNYVLTANEGDAREYFFDAGEAACSAAGSMDWDEDDGCLAWSDEKRVRKLELDATVFPDAKSLQKKKNLGRLKAVATEGDIDGDGDHDAIVAFGARSFSIWDADSGEQVFDSGDDFERITAEALGTTGFNATDDENGFDDRSDDKGPEPEALAVGEVGGRRYAFIGLERTGGIVVYDITQPSAAAFVQYVTNRNYTVDIEDNLPQAGDLAPEGMTFVPAADSPTGHALLIVGNEVSGTVAVYEVR